jgi:cysteine desulfuration protein SufE
MNPVQTISDISDDIVEEFGFFDSWMERYEHLIDLGRNLPLIDNAYRTDAHRIKGCQSQVWLHAEIHDGNVVFTADSDAFITKGLIALLVRVLNNRRPSEIQEADLSFLDRIEMKDHLSPTRKNGLDAMIKQIRLYAVAFSQTPEKT